MSIYRPKMDWYTEGKWLIHCTKHCKSNHLQSLEHPSRYSDWEYIINANEFHGTKFNPIFKTKLSGQKHPWELDRPREKPIPIDASEKTSRWWS